MNFNSFISNIYLFRDDRSVDNLSEQNYFYIFLKHILMIKSLTPF